MFGFHWPFLGMATSYLPHLLTSSTEVGRCILSILSALTRLWLPVSGGFTVVWELTSSAQGYDKKRPIRGQQQNYSSFSSLVAKRNWIKSEELIRSLALLSRAHDNIIPYPDKFPVHQDETQLCCSPVILFAEFLETEGRIDKHTDFWTGISNCAHSASEINRSYSELSKLWSQ